MKFRHLLPLTLISLLVLLNLSSCQNAEKQLPDESNFGSWAKTPPMGWNSYNCFGGNVTEAEVKANADYCRKSETIWMGIHRG